MRSEVNFLGFYHTQHRHPQQIFTKTSLGKLFVINLNCFKFSGFKFEAQRA